MVEDGRLTYEDARNGYGSWRGNAQWYNADRTLWNMDKLYNGLFIDPFVEGNY
jgi:hypothetical protein